MSVIDNNPLYPLNPEGLRTFYIESVTSYLARLTSGYNVQGNALLNDVIIPVSAEKHASSTFHHTMNGLEEYANTVIKRLETLTGNDQMEFLTLRPWFPVLSNTRLIRRNKAWCPLCYEDWNLSDKPMYDPLIWWLSPLQTCPIHHTPLVSICPHEDCGKTIRNVSLPGFCGYCGRSLAVTPSNYTPTPSNNEFDTWVVNNCKELIVGMWDLPTPHDRTDVTDAMTSIIAFYNGTSAFSRKFHVAPETASGWRHGRIIPTLSTLLSVSYDSNIPLTSILTNDIESYIPVSHQSTHEKPPITPEGIQDKAKYVLQYFAPQSLAEFARQVGCSKQTLLKYIPNAREIILGNREAAAATVESCPASKPIRLDMSKKTDRLVAQNALQQSLLSTEHESLNKIAKTIGMDVATMRFNFRSLCTQVVKRNRLVRDAERKRVLGQLEYYLATTPPLSLNKVSKAVGKTPRQLIKLSSETCKAIQDRYFAYMETTSHPKRGKSNHHQEYSEIKSLVDRVISSQDPIPLVEFMKRYGHSIKGFPDLCSAVVENYRKHTARLRQSVCDNIREAVYHFQSLGQYPSQNAVGNYINKPKFHKNKTYLSTWRSAISEVTNENL